MAVKPFSGSIIWRLIATMDYVYINVVPSLDRREFKQNVEAAIHW